MSRAQAELSSSSTLLVVVGDQSEVLDLFGRLDVHRGTVAVEDPFGELMTGLSGFLIVPRLGSRRASCTGGVSVMVWRSLVVGTW
jgi:hypothetical protein